MCRDNLCKFHGKRLSTLRLISVHSCSLVLELINTEQSYLNKLLNVSENEQQPARSHDSRSRRAHQDWSNWSGEENSNSDYTRWVSMADHSIIIHGALSCICDTKVLNTAVTFCLKDTYLKWLKRSSWIEIPRAYIVFSIFLEKSSSCSRLKLVHGARFA